MRSLWMCVCILYGVSISSATNPGLSLDWRNTNCIGGDNGLLSTGLWLSLNASDGTGLCYSNRSWIEYDSFSSLSRLHESFLNCNRTSNVTFEFEQPEHGGGNCHCVQISFNSPTSKSFE